MGYLSEKSNVKRMCFAVSRCSALPHCPLPAALSGLDGNLCAPPEIHYPVCTAAMPKGRLFVGVDKNNSLSAALNRGKIVLCTDSDRDGQGDVYAVLDSEFPSNVLVAKLAGLMGVLL
ncbi:MAG: hypothetical protein M2R45_01863 [Verrucomicrobia subdivision 3 bacterium]|nr:hypothetical protein [Limisphaerales bacterium]MCS1415663.1 hypothetical protein [Limisphaerales bacterium]